MNPNTLHRRISTELAGQITSGVWPPGHRIPSEHQLVALYGCARATVGKAVHALVVQGLVERRRKAGTFVSIPHVSSAVLRIPDIRAEVEARGLAYRWLRIERRVRRAGGQEEAALAAAGLVLEVAGVHYASARAFAFERRLISLEQAPEARDEEFITLSPGAWLLGHVAWSEARHELSAINPDLETAEALQIPRARACLCLKRLTWRQGVAVTLARQIFPGDLFDLTATFAPIGG